MIECTLKATVIKTVSEKNPIYGKTTQIHEVCNTLQMDSDKRDDICPVGIFLMADINGAYIKLSISRHYFDSDDEGWYYTSFSKDGYIYRLDMLYKDCHIEKESTKLSVYYMEDYIDCGSPIETVYATEFDKLDVVFL
jgi:hypothetical protein